MLGQALAAQNTLSHGLRAAVVDVRSNLTRIRLSLAEGEQACQCESQLPAGIYFMRSFVNRAK